MGGTYVEKHGASDEVKKAASKLGIEVDAMRKETDEMRRESRRGFAAAN
jgi:ribosomal protein L13E